MLLRLADEYARRGASQTICIRKDGWLADEVRRRGIALEIIPVGKTPDLGWFRAVVRLAKLRRVTAIHSHEFAMNVRAGVLAKILRVPVVATVHGKAYYGEKWIRRLAYRFLARTVHLVAVSGDIRNYLIDRLKVRSKDVTVICNGIDIERFRRQPEVRDRTRTRLGVEQHQLLLGAVGSYYPVKGHSFLLDALKEILRIHPNLRLILAGQGPLEEKLRKQVQTGSLGDHVDIAGYVEDITGL
mgnify:CR=1 FL=1